MLSREELATWLRLCETPGLGPVAGRRLLAAFGSPERIFEAGPQAWQHVVDATVAQALAEPNPACDALVERTWQWLQTPQPDAPRTVITLDDPRYPERLLQIADPPLLLYTIGRVDLLKNPGLAIVGSRRATPQGLENAREFAYRLSEHPLTIVSGLAQGIDGAAHAGGLAGPGSTIAFVGTGLDLVYPHSHRELAQAIATGGLLASDYSLGTPPLPENFPRRNRLIAGQALGTLVVEAALKSGSLITARLAAEAGREVFALPGSIHSQQSRGCHRLIQEGALLVETPGDILRELGLGPASPAARARPAPAQLQRLPEPRPDAESPAHELAGPDAALLDALGYDPVTFDALSARTGEPSDRLAARMLALELDGAVQRLPGGLWQRRANT